MSIDYRHELGLLRSIISFVELRAPLDSCQLRQKYLRTERLAVLQSVEDGVLVVRLEAGKSFEDLCNRVVAQSPPMARGAKFSSIRIQVLNELRKFIGRAPSAITLADAVSLQAALDEWFSKRVAEWRIFLPCFISPWASPSFQVGPTQFVFAADGVKGESVSTAADLNENGRFDRLFDLMADNKADWLACVTISGCDRERAEELAGLAADLAVAGLQLAIPLEFGTRTMGRLDTRRGAAERIIIMEADGHSLEGRVRLDAGMSIGTGTLSEMLRDAEPIISAVGARVLGFASGQFKLEKLERAWCDAAYWLHEALAEPVDAIAIAKLETALEVLLRAESSSGSSSRLKAVLSSFYDLSPDDPVADGSWITAGEFVRRFVKERSCILHGSWSTLNSQIALGRSGLEEFVMAVLRRAVLKLDAYTRLENPSDDIDEFLSWVTSGLAGDAR